MKLHENTLEKGQGSHDQAGGMKALPGRDFSAFDSDDLTAILGAIPEGIIILDQAGRITFWNDQTEKIFGWDKNAAIGQYLISFIIPVHLQEDCNNRVNKCIVSAIESYDPNKLIELDAITKEHRPIHIELKILPLKKSGQQNFCVFVKDISERKLSVQQLEEQKDFYLSILENIPTDIAMFDPDHRYQYVNPFAVKDPELRNHIIGKDDFEYSAFRNRDPSLAEKRRGYFNLAKETGITAEWEDSTTDTNGEKMTSLRRFYPVLDKDKNLKLMIGFGLDITERKKLEQKVWDLNQELEQKIKERTAELQTANDELNTFNYMVSHDLQAPLRSLSGFANLMSRKYNGIIDQEGQELLEMIKQNSHYMSDLIKGLLRFAQLGKSPLSKMDVDITGIVNSVVEDIKQGNSKTEISVEINTPIADICDPILVRQVWSNLIGNAVKYSAKKEKPLVRIGLMRQGDEDIYFVKDNGAGFDMKRSDKLFNIFQRLHTQQEFEGTGAGLAIVHRIISRHGGRIWVEAAPDVGASFYFTLRPSSQSL